MEKQQKIYTLEDVARELGVSKTTVSRAISGKGRIGRETRERVQQFIETHDYQPNVMARGLAQKKTYNLGLLLPVDYGNVEFSFFKECMAGIYRVASEYNYDLILSMVEGTDLAQLQRLVRNRKMDGMIVSRAMEHSAVQQYLKESGLPFVVIGASQESQVETVDNPNREAVDELTRTILLRGGGHLALLGGDERHSVTKSRMEGYEDAHKKLGIRVNPDTIFLNLFSYPAVMEAIERALEAGVRTFLCMDDYISDMVLGCLREKKIEIPGTVKVASMYDSQKLERNMPSVTSIRFDSARLGGNACLRLLRMLGERVEKEEPAGYELVLRESTK